MWIRRLVGSMIAWLVVVAMPSAASACAVCTAGKDEENAFAFLMSTIFMSITPLAAIGTLIFVLWRRIRKLDAEASERAAHAQSASPATRSETGLPADTVSVLPHTS